MTLPNLAWATLPWAYDDEGMFIFDSRGHKVLDIRGWGVLTGGGALHLDEETASKAQKEVAKHVVETVNTYGEALREIKKKVFKEKIREAIRLTKKMAVEAKDAGTGGAIMAINEEDILKQVLE